jgi:hypothetical protein
MSAGKNDTSVSAARHQFERDGFIVKRGYLADDADFHAIATEVERIARMFHPEFSFHDAPASIKKMNREQRSSLYRSLRYLASITQMACHPGLLQLSRDLGLAEPAVMHSYNLRMDLPEEDEFLFHWHQDSTYLLGSANAVTYWIPLVPVSPQTVGSIMVIPGSHHGGIRPYTTAFDKDGGPAPSRSLSPKDAYLRDEPDPTDAIPIEAEVGDVVVFNQMLLHASLPNRGKGARWTLQVRHADLAEPDFRAAGFPMGDSTNIAHHDYLPGWKYSDREKHS